MFYNLYLGKIISLPKNADLDDFQIIYCLDKDCEILDEINDLNLNYLLIILQKTEKSSNEAIDLVQSEWKNLADSLIEVEFITNDLKKISKNFRNLLLDCEMENVIFKAQVIGFQEKSLRQMEFAKKIILKVATKSKWNFWS